MFEKADSCSSYDAEDDTYTTDKSGLAAQEPVE